MKFVNLKKRVETEIRELRMQGSYLSFKVHVR